MKKYSLAFSLLFVSLVLAFFSCKKINEATELGGDLIPAVDNVHTFEVSLNSITKNGIYDDSSRVAYTDFVALGDINEPEFGHIHANFNFNINPAIIGSYPFATRDGLTMDSVVLQLAYQDAYGDTVGNGQQSVTVYEISPSANFRADTLYKYKDASTDNMAGSQLSIGSTTYRIASLKDSINVIRPGDTVRTANVVRIKLNNSLGTRFASYDTSASPTIGAYHSDSLFHTIFKGLAVKASNTGQALSYFDLTSTKTKLTVYYRYKLASGTDSLLSVEFYHIDNGQSNYVSAPPDGNWRTALNSSAGDKIYLQTSPSGAYAAIKIPDLDNFGNKVINRAEIIATRVPTGSDLLFPPPGQLILDRINSRHDTAFILQNDLTPSADGSINFATFGGNFRTDNTYHLNITRYVQSIITRHLSNDSLRLYAPLRTVLFASNLPTTTSTVGSFIAVPVIREVGAGRIVLAGGNYSDPNMRLRLRIIYSNL